MQHVRPTSLPSLDYHETLPTCSQVHLVQHRRLDDLGCTLTFGEVLSYRGQDLPHAKLNLFSAVNV